MHDETSDPQFNVGRSSRLQRTHNRQRSIDRNAWLLCSLLSVVRELLGLDASRPSSRSRARGNRSRLDSWGTRDSENENSVCFRSLTEEGRIVTTEQHFELLEAIELATGRRPNYTTAWRWHRKGISTPNGRVHLECSRVGGRVMTSVEAVERFNNTIQRERGLPVSKRSTTAPITRQQIERQTSFAMKKLERLGFFKTPKKAGVK